jgi:uncharacterized protein (DUF1501 family)
MNKFTRRDFVKSAALAAAGLSLHNPVLEAAAKTARQAVAPGVTSANEKVLVVINLFGGNDGCNTVVPIAPSNIYNQYLTLRPLTGLGFDLGEVLMLNGVTNYALRPNMQDFQTLYNNGNLAIINGVGVPLNALRKYDHDAQQNTFQSCSTGSGGLQAPTGWMGRYCDAAPLGSIPPGIDLGGGRLMVSGQVRQPVSIYTLNDFKLQISTGEPEKTQRRNTYTTIMNTPVPEGGVGEQNRLYRVQAMAQSNAIFAAIATYPTPTAGQPGSPYKNTWLARQLQEAAKLIYGNIGAQCIALGIGGFDTHSNQEGLVGNPPIPYHGYLMNRVAESVKAMFDDLTNLGLADRVLILTISEFGRTPWENIDGGTDHGIASSAFVVGTTANINGGIYGVYPDLFNFQNEDGLVTTVDFRSVYSTIVANFLNADPVPICGGNFPLLGFCD